MRANNGWGSYAAVYDLMASCNPAYQELIRLFAAEVRSWALPTGSTLVDIGAGTGNFAMELAKNFPAAAVVKACGARYRYSLKGARSIAVSRGCSAQANTGRMIWRNSAAHSALPSLKS